MFATRTGASRRYPDQQSTRQFRFGFRFRRLLLDHAPYSEFVDNRHRLDQRRGIVQCVVMRSRDRFLSSCLVSLEGARRARVVCLLSQPSLFFFNCRGAPKALELEAGGGKGGRGNTKVSWRGARAATHTKKPHSNGN